MTSSAWINCWIWGETGIEISSGEIVGQNVKLELIKARLRANEWFIVIMDRQWKGTIWPLCSEFTSLSPYSSFFSLLNVKQNIHENKLW